VRVSMAFNVLLCSGNDALPQQRSILRAVHPFNPNKKHIRFLGGSSVINQMHRRRTQGLLWASRGLFLLAAAMVGLVVACCCARDCSPTPPPILPPPSRKK
jgi:hypothetical protein